jgi:carboxyl-terminal processing protease
MSSAPTPPNPDRPEPSADAIERPYADERIQADELDHSRPSRDRRRIAPSRFSLILVAIMAGSALFMGGFSLGAHIATTPGTPADQETRFGPFWDVYSLIQSDFAGSPRPSQDQLVQAAIKGMMESLNDPWSYYQGPSDFANSLLNVGGQAEGIGAQIQVQPVDPNSTQSCTTIGNGCELAVVEPIPGSPAEAAGIKPGDVIATVGGKSLDGLTIDQAIALIKGPQDTTVVIGLIRGTTTIEKSIVRKIYDQPEVDTRTLANGAVAYIHIDGINDPASSQFKQALATALAAGRHNVVLDLRGNLGGYVEDAVKIASEFIGSGTIAYQVDSTGKKSAVTATAGGQATDPSVHVVVLVDGNTASAAEILAGALQARGRAQLRRHTPDHRRLADPEQRLDSGQGSHPGHHQQQLSEPGLVEPPSRHRPGPRCRPAATGLPGRVRSVGQPRRLLRPDGWSSRLLQPQRRPDGRSDVGPNGQPDLRRATPNGAVKTPV